MWNCNTEFRAGPHAPPVKSELSPVHKALLYWVRAELRFERL